MHFYTPLDHLVKLSILASNHIQNPLLMFLKLLLKSIQAIDVAELWWGIRAFKEVHLKEESNEWIEAP